MRRKRRKRKKKRRRQNKGTQETVAWELGGKTRENGFRHGRWMDPWRPRLLRGQVEIANLTTTFNGGRGPQRRTCERSFVECSCVKCEDHPQWVGDVKVQNTAFLQILLAR